MFEIVNRTVFLNKTESKKIKLLDQLLKLIESCNRSCFAPFFGKHCHKS